MKKIVLFIFMLSNFISFAQMNEINISYQTTSFGQFQNGTSLTYYRSIGSKNYFGLRTNFQWFKSNDFFTPQKIYTGSIDLVNRRDFISKNKFRFWGELGISVKRQKEFHQNIYENCFCLPPVDIDLLIIEKKWIKGNQLGFSSSVGIDYQFFKAFKIGLIFALKKYTSNKQLGFYTDNHISSLSILLGYKF